MRGNGTIAALLIQANYVVFLLKTKVIQDVREDGDNANQSLRHANSEV